MSTVTVYALKANYEANKEEYNAFKKGLKTGGGAALQGRTAASVKDGGEFKFCPIFFKTNDEKKLDKGTEVRFKPISQKEFDEKFTKPGVEITYSDIADFEVSSEKTRGVSARILALGQSTPKQPAASVYHSNISAFEDFTPQKVIKLLPGTLKDLSTYRNQVADITGKLKAFYAKSAVTRFFSFG